MFNYLLNAINIIKQALYFLYLQLQLSISKINYLPSYILTKTTAIYCDTVLCNTIRRDAKSLTISNPSKYSPLAIINDEARLPQLRPSNPQSLVHVCGTVSLRLCDLLFRYIFLQLSKIVNLKNKRDLCITNILLLSLLNFIFLNTEIHGNLCTCCSGVIFVNKNYSAA